MLPRILALAFGLAYACSGLGCSHDDDSLTGSGCESHDCGFDRVICYVDCLDPPSVTVAYFRGGDQVHLMWTGESSAEIVATVSLDESGEAAFLALWESSAPLWLEPNEQGCAFDEGPPWAAGQRLAGTCSFVDEQEGEFEATFCCRPVEMEDCGGFVWDPL